MPVLICIPTKLKKQHKNKLKMSIEKRRFIRFSLDIPAFSFNKEGNRSQIVIKQISIGGCLAELDENIYLGDEFRIEMILPNKNRLPLYGKAVYEFAGKGMGVKFKGISQFEQELVGKIISDTLETEGLPLLVDPFLQPPQFSQREDESKKNNQNEKQIENDLIEETIAT